MVQACGPRGVCAHKAEKMLCEVRILTRSHRPVGKAVNPQDTRTTPGICQQPAHEPEGVVMFTYKCKRWRDLAARAMRRDGYKCQLSARYGRSVEADMVHHIYPVDQYPEYGYCLWNLISLSNAEHNKLHDRDTGELTAAGVALMRRTKIP